MLNVGLTGNVAAGKSLVAGWFAEWGATVVDADQLVRDVQRPGSPVLAAISETLGRAFIAPGGELDRPALRRRILTDRAARAALNAIVHPAVRAARDQLARTAAARGDCILVNDIPLLFETLDPAAFDVVILVDAEEALRRRRLVEQRGIPPEEADALLRSQLPAAGKRDRSDVVLDNNGTPGDLRRAAWDLWVTLRSRAAREMAGSDGAPQRRVVALVCHAGDESFLIGGTLARLADAGAETAVWLVETPAGGPPSESLARAAAALAVRDLRRLAAPPHAVAAALEDPLRQTHPDAVVTIEDVNAADDHQRLNAAARASAAKLGIPAWSNLPGASGAAAALDVRPWLDVKRQAIAAYRAAPCTRAASGIADREYFRDAAQSSLRADLFGA
jgi:dephospho-CoA kinase